ncbi:MAG: GAF domain-containing protein [Bryobacteraceae bacterium]
MARGKENEHRIERLENQVHLYQKLSRFFARPPALTEALATVVNHVARFLHADSCLLYLSSREELVLSAAHGPNPAAVGTVKLKLDEGLTGWVARERRLLAITREAFLDQRFKFFQDLPEDRFEAFLSAPVIALNRVVGVINVQHRSPHAHGGDEMEMLTSIGEIVGGLVALSCSDPAGFEQADYARVALTNGAGTGR